MPNSPITPNWVTNEVARILVNELHFGNNVNRDYDDQYEQAGAKVGYVVNARLPQQYVVTKGQALQIQNVTDQVVPIALTDQANIGIEFSTASLTMEISAYRERYIRPAVAALINQIDFDGLSRMYKTVNMTVGTPGTVPNSNSTYLSAGVKLGNASCPPDGRIGIIDLQAEATIVAANLALFNPAAAISEQYKSGMFGRDVLGVSEWYRSQNVAVHTVGPLGGTPTVKGANQVGNSLITNGWTSAAANRLLQGDVVQLASVYAVNPQNRQSTGTLLDLVVTADTNSDSSGNATIPISPALITTGAYQTASASPADGALIQVFSTAAAGQAALASTQSHMGLVYHPDAFALVMADLEMPQGVWAAERVNSKQYGISVRFVKAYDVMSDQAPARLDVLYGWSPLRQSNLACRVAAA